MGVEDRPRQTLPPGLEVRASDIPDAGLGVFNMGETVCVGTHFGPYQGELVDQEKAMNSGNSWVVSEITVLSVRFFFVMGSQWKFWKPDPLAKICKSTPLHG